VPEDPRDESEDRLEEVDFQGLTDEELARMLPVLDEYEPLDFTDRDRPRWWPNRD
jgi:hypothetical protein